jgi:hypothetical protein
MTAVGWSPRTDRLVRHVLLPAWFALMTAYHLSAPRMTDAGVGLDARIYYRGAAAWVHGADPWAAVVPMGAGRYHFAGTPPTVQVFALFTAIPESAFVVLWLVVTLISATFILGRLRLPGSWLLFPPMAEALISGNPQIAILALLLAGGTLLPAVAPLLKVYALVPVLGEGRWKIVVVAAALLMVSAAWGLGLWRDYVARFPEITERLNLEAAGGYSAWGLPLFSLLVVVAALVVLALVDRRSAAWLAVPALWPASQIHYSTFALPVITPALAFVLAIPQQGIPALVVVALAVSRLGELVLARMHPPAGNRDLDRGAAGS